VVTTDIGAAPEIVTEKCGMLVPRDDAEALASALRLLLRDEPTRARLGQNGPGRAAALCEPAGSVKQLYSTLSEIRG